MSRITPVIPLHKTTIQKSLETVPLFTFCMVEIALDSHTWGGTSPHTCHTRSYMQSPYGGHRVKFEKFDISLTFLHQSCTGRAKCHTYPTFGSILYRIGPWNVENSQWNLKFLAYIYRRDRIFFFFFLFALWETDLVTGSLVPRPPTLSRAGGV